MANSSPPEPPPQYAPFDPGQQSLIATAHTTSNAHIQASLLQPHDLELHKVDHTSAFHVQSKGDTLYYVGHYQAQATPDIILYAGYDSDGPRLAQVQFLMNTKDFQVYVGDLKTPSSDDWDTVRCAGGGMFKDPSYRFESRSPGQSGRSVKNRYYWKKTSDSSLGASKTSPRDFKLVDESDEQVVAVYIEHHMGARAKRGTLTFRQPISPKAEVAALMVLLSLLEKSRRYMKSVARAFPNTNGY